VVQAAGGIRDETASCPVNGGFARQSVNAAKGISR
jgi:hypothetical protein